MGNEQLPKIDLSQLRQLTDQSKINLQQLKQMTEKSISENNDRKQKINQLMAEKVLSKVLGKCEKEAKKGQSKAKVMVLKYGRDYQKYNLTSDNLIGPALIVWNYLQDNKLNPTIEYWHDGIGIEGGFDIFVNW